MFKKDQTAIPPNLVISNQKVSCLIDLLEGGPNVCLPENAACPPSNTKQSTACPARHVLLRLSCWLGWGAPWEAALAGAYTVVQVQAKL